MQNRVYLVALALLISFLPTGVFSVPSTVSYQGKLTDSSGVPINGNTAITFSLYSVATGGTAMWSESYDGNSGRPIINVVNGHFSVELGSITALTTSDFSSSSVYLGIKVGTDSEMTPRVPILSSPFAFQADNSDTVDNLNASSFLRSDATSSGSHKLMLTVNTSTDWVMQLKQESASGYGLEVETVGSGTVPAIKVTNSGSSLFRVQNDGKVGIGVASATEALEVNGTVKASNFLDSDGNSIVSVDQIWNREDIDSPAYFLENNVGVGTTSPGSKLTVVAPGGEDGIKVVGNTDEESVVVGAVLELEANIDYRGRGVLLTHRNPSSGDKSMWFSGVPYEGNGFQIGVSDVLVSATSPARKEQSVLYITESGDVGIGTTSPSNKLDVTGDAILGEAQIGSTTYDANYAVFQHKSAADYGFIHDSSGRALVNSAAGQPIDLRIENQTKLRIDSTGKAIAYEGLEAGDGTNKEVLRLNTERPWVFEGGGSGSISYLVFRPTVNGKRFLIKTEDDASTLFEVDAENIVDDSSISMLRPGGRLFIGAGSRGDNVMNVSGNTRIDGTVQGTTFVGSFSGEGSGLTGLNASSLVSGTVDLSRLPAIPNSKLAAGAALDNLGGDSSETEELFLSKTGVWKQPSQLSSAKIIITEDELKRSDDQNLILDGLLKQMVFKTRGQDVYPDAGSGVEAAAFLWMYGGNNSYNQVMHLNNSGDLWTKQYGYLPSYFMTRAEANTITSNVTFGDSGFSMIANGAGSFSGLNINESAVSGAPQNDGFRMRFDTNFFDTSNDGIIFEKTDRNEDQPDGGFAFVNTGQTGTSVAALVIRGTGHVGIGTLNPTEKLDVNGTVKATAFSGAITASDISSGILPIERLSGDSAAGSVNKFLNEKGDWEIVNVTVGMSNMEIPVYNGTNLVASALSDDATSILMTDRNFVASKDDGSSLVMSLTNKQAQTVGVELRSEGGANSFIDFSKNDTEDYNVRLISDATNRLTLKGDYYVDGNASIEQELSVNTIEIRGGADLAEKFETKESEVEPGTVMVIDPEMPGRLTVSTKAYDRLVAGIVSGANDLMPGVVLSDDTTLNGTSHPIALSGRVWVKCSDEAGDVKPGDLLTTSSVPGHVMKVTSFEQARGAVIGKAMSPIQGGLVLVLVSLQ